MLNFKRSAHVVSEFSLNCPAVGALAGAPLSPILGQYQLPIVDFCKRFNELTNIYQSGVILSSFVQVYNNRSFDILVRGPVVNQVFRTAVLNKSENYLTPGEVFDICRILSLNDAKFVSRVCVILSSLKLNIKFI